MAYLNFSQAVPAGGYPAPVRGDMATAAPVTGFSALEWLVIGLAQRDPLSSLATPGRLSLALRGLFGLGTASRLADDRLERLRRMAVLIRHRGWRIPESEIAAFLALFTEDQLDRLVATVGVGASHGRNRLTRS